MSDLSITAANVLAAEGAPTEHGMAGEAVSAGKTGYKSSTTKKWMLADSNSVTPEAREAEGIFLCNAALNQPVTVAKPGSDVTLGAVLTAGTSYYQSDTAGGICPIADVGTGEEACFLGIAKSTTVLHFDPQPSGVTL